MNERIKELADKIWAEEYWNNPNTDKLLPAQLNKFAELIVRESIEILEHRYKWDGDVTEGKETKMCIAKIKQHFGVD